MYRFAASRTFTAVSALAVARCAASTAVKPVGKLGVPHQLAEVAAAHRIPESLIDKIENPRVVAFTWMNLARESQAPLIASVDESVDYRSIADSVAARVGPNPTPVKGALSKFKSTEWKNMKDVITLYEEAMYPIRAKQHEFNQYQLTSFHIKDVLKRGLSAFKQDFLDAQKKEQTQVLAKMKECEDYISAAAKDAFDTDVLNDIVNILRIAGEKHEHAHAMAIKVLDDMTRMKIPFNDLTREIMQSLVFADGPFDNSPLLFEVTESPERGEISLSKGGLEKVSDDILKLISNRHQTPLDDGVLLRSPETHPNLQRSPE